MSLPVLLLAHSLASVIVPKLAKNVPISDLHPDTSYAIVDDSQIVELLRSSVAAVAVKDAVLLLLMLSSFARVC